MTLKSPAAGKTAVSAAAGSAVTPQHTSKTDAEPQRQDSPNKGPEDGSWKRVESRPQDNAQFLTSGKATPPSVELTAVAAHHESAKQTPQADKNPPKTRWANGAGPSSGGSNGRKPPTADRGSAKQKS